MSTGGKDSLHGSRRGSQRQREIVEVDAEQGQRLDNFLLARLKELPKSRVYRMLRRGEVRVNGSRARPGYRVQRGDRVRLPPHRAAAESAARQQMPPPAAFEAMLAGAIYQDDDLLVLDKPSGLAVHGGSGVAFGVIETLRAGDPRTRYELAHRLDRDTSGCLAVAKNRRALLQLHAAFREGQVGKRYDLIVAGRWPARLRAVELPLLRYLLPNGERRVRASAAGEAARTNFAIVDRLEGATWLAAFPKTGRTHQIRVHAATSGYPILGDDKYALGKSPTPMRLMLHASELKLMAAGARRRFVAPLPAEFEALRRAGSAPPSAAARRA